MLIIYPTADYDSFLSVADCTTLSDSYIANNKFSLLSDDTEREAVLRQTCLMIKQCPNITLPEDIENDLELSQMYLVEQALTVDMMAYDPNGGSINSEQVDTLAVSYDTSKKEDNDTFPPVVYGLLRRYGCAKPSSFSQSYLGRS